MRVDVRDLGVNYGHQRVLHGVNLRLEAGKLLGIIGPNGSGKSTLVRCMAGMIAPGQGAVLFDGQSIAPARVGYMPQDLSGRVNLSALEVVLLGRHGQLGWRVQEADLRQAMRWMERLGVAALANAEMSALSGGQRQLVYLAQALMGESGVLLLDEPTSALDLCHQVDALDAVRDLTLELGLCTAIVTHDLHLVSRYSHEVLLLDSGQVTARGTWSEVWPMPAMEAAFRIRLTPLRDATGHVHLVPGDRRAEASREGASSLALA